MVNGLRFRDIQIRNYSKIWTWCCGSNCHKDKDRKYCRNEHNCCLLLVGVFRFSLNNVYSGSSSSSKLSNRRHGRCWICFSHQYKHDHFFCSCFNALRYATFLTIWIPALKLWPHSATLSLELRKPPLENAKEPAELGPPSLPSSEENPHPASCLSGEKDPFKLLVLLMFLSCAETQ